MRPDLTLQNMGFRGRCNRRQFLQAGALGLGLLACPGLARPAFGQEVRFGFTRPFPAAYAILLANGNIR